MPKLDQLITLFAWLVGPCDYKPPTACWVSYQIYLQSTLGSPNLPRQVRRQIYKGAIPWTIAFLPNYTSLSAVFLLVAVPPNASPILSARRFKRPRWLVGKGKSLRATLVEGSVSVITRAPVGSVDSNKELQVRRPGTAYRWEFDFASP
jgi:hypothetical protein